MIDTPHSIARLLSYSCLQAGYRGSKQPHTMWDLQGLGNGRSAFADQGWTNGFYLYFLCSCFYFYIDVTLRHGMCVLYDVQYDIMLQTWVAAGCGVVLHEWIWVYGAPWGAWGSIRSPCSPCA